MTEKGIEKRTHLFIEQAVCSWAKEVVRERPLSAKGGLLFCTSAIERLPLPRRTRHDRTGLPSLAE
jgi:hypothetical protein